jgi:hypothetical protein
MPGAQLTGQQLATKDYARFADFETMDTQPLRQGLPPNRLAWCENVQIDAPNKLVALPGPAFSPLNTIPGKTVVKMWGVNSSPLDPGFASTPSVVCFCSDGSLQYVTHVSVTQIFPPGGLINPDVVVYSVPPVLELLIVDPNGYAAWNSVNGLITSGSVSPHIVVTNGGSGYAGGATAAITGGSGSGATATVTVVGGIVTAVTLTNGGSGYKAGDVLTVTISPVAGGAGATATAIVWPFISQFPSTAAFAGIAIFAGRVWLAVGKNLIWTGTKGLDDVNPANAAGSTLLSDADVVFNITALRNLNNFLWIFCDQAIKQIGTVGVSGSTTVFSIVTLSSDIGCEWPLSIQSYNRLVLFGHNTGIYAVLGSSVEKISEPMQGIFDSADFSQQLSAFIADINNRHVYGVLIRYIDPLLATTRSLIMIFQRGAWYVLNQGSGLTAVGYIIVGNGTIRIYGSSGADVTQLVAALPGQATAIFVQTALTDHGKPHMGKKLLRQSTANFATHVAAVTMTVDTENGSDPENYNLIAGVVPVTSFQYVRGKANGSGIYLGFTWSGNVPAIQFALHSAIIEYQETTALSSKVGV